MGGTESKIQDEQLVSTCKHRYQFMKEALSTRNAFAAAHSAYAMSLKNTGAALSAFAHREFPYDPSAPAANEPMLVVEENMELPVPMPAVVKKGGRKVGRRVRKPLTLLQIFQELNDHFFKAFESTREVSKMLEAIRLQLNQKPINRFKRVMHVISRNPSVGDFGAEENEVYATVSDEMLAWEKKLYEVKAGEIMKYEYQKKVALLNKKKKRDSSDESLEKLKASASQLHTRYTVDMQSVDSIVAEINRLRDQQLYPKLVELVDGMAKMWETIRYHHETQTNIAYAMKPLDDSESLRGSTYYDNLTFMLFECVQAF